MVSVSQPSSLALTSDNETKDLIAVPVLSPDLARNHHLVNRSKGNTMTKSTITKLFIGGTLAAIAGAILAVLAFGIAYASDVFIMSGDQVVGVSGGALAWSLIAVGILGALAAMGGLICRAGVLDRGTPEHLAAR